MRELAKIAIAKLEQAPKRKQALRLWLRLLTVTHLIEGHIRTRLREEFQTTLPRFDCMAALAREPDGQRMGDLSRWLLVTNGNVTGVIERLEEEGLAVRQRAHNDKRARWVRLTPKGFSEFEKRARTHEQWIKELLRTLTPEEMQTLDRILKKIKTRLAHGDIDGSHD